MIRYDKLRSVWDIKGLHIICIVNMLEIHIYRSMAYYSKDGRNILTHIYVTHNI